MALMRIDKFLADSGAGTRSQVKALISKGKVSVDDCAVKNAAFKVDENCRTVKINGIIISYNKYVYIMLNKPKGVVSAVSDKKYKTVVDCAEEYKARNIFPVGRLDIDTTGLLILTNDGNFAHNTLSPKKHVDKTYYLEAEGELDNMAVEKIKEGIVIDGNYKCKPALLNIIKCENNKTYGEITISEGKFHQVKRMIEAVGGKVTELKRIKFGDIALDENLKEGEYRLLNDAEIQYVKSFEN